MDARMKYARPRFSFALTLLATALASAMPAYAQTTWYVDDNAANDPGSVASSALCAAQLSGSSENREDPASIHNARSDSTIPVSLDCTLRAYVDPYDYECGTMGEDIGQNHANASGVCGFWSIGGCQECGITTVQISVQTENSLNSIKARSWVDHSTYSYSILEILSGTIDIGDTSLAPIGTPVLMNVEMSGDDELNCEFAIYRDGTQLLALNDMGSGVVNVYSGEILEPHLQCNPSYSHGETANITFTTYLDCNENSIADSEDIASGDSLDLDSNGIPDECEVQTIFLSEDTTIDADDTSYDGANIVVEDCVLLVESDHTFASLALLNARLGAPDESCGLKLTITGDVFVDVTSAIMAPSNCSGESGGQCVQYYADTSMMCDHFEKAGGGGGHGGSGGDAGDASGGGTHGDQFWPVSVGGEGGCWGEDWGMGIVRSYGGGTIQLAVGGVLHVDGVIRADGENGQAGYFSNDGYGDECYDVNWYAGGGAGGSILLVVNSLGGGGMISASGGLGAGNYAPEPDGGDGGGGRVAVYFRTSGSFDPANISVSGYEDGTIYTAQIDEFMLLADCLAGPDQSPTPSILTEVATCLTAFDFDDDGDVDLSDFALFQVQFAP